MDRYLLTLIDKLHKEKSLLLEEYQTLIEGYSPQNAEYAAENPENYYCVFRIKDVQGNISYSEMIPLK